MCLRYSTSHYISKTKPGIVKDKIYKKPASYSLFCFGKKKKTISVNDMSSAFGRISPAGKCFPERLLRFIAGSDGV